MFGEMRIRRGSSDDDGGYRLPPALAKLPTDRGRLQKGFVERFQRDKILSAALAVFGTKGFAATTVQDLIDEAGMSRGTFYKYFGDKDACLLALVEEVVGWLAEEARDAAAGAEDWQAAVVAVTRRLVELLLDDPRLARVCATESLSGGPAVRERRERALAELERGLRKGRGERPWGEGLPSSIELLSVHGALSVVTRRVADSDSKRKKLPVELAELVLLPYLGAEDARLAVRSSRPRR